MDPNKYKGNEDIRPESLLRTVTSTASMALMVVGIVGIALETFRGDGLLEQLALYLFQSTKTMLLIPVILLVLWLLNRFISTPSKSETKKSGNLPMYIMMGFGVYYTFRLLTTGAF